MQNTTAYGAHHYGTMTARPFEGVDVFGLAARVLASVSAWGVERRQRAALLDLDDRLLDDIGLTRGDIINR